MTWLDHLACALVDQAAIQSVAAEGSGPVERKPSLAERRAAHGIAPLSVEERAELLDANLTTAAEELGWRDWNEKMPAEGSGPVQIDDSVRDVCDRGALETIAAYHRLGEHTHGSWSDQILSSLSLIHWRFG